MFHQDDRDTLNRILTKLERLRLMPTRAELDAALAREDQDITDAIDRYSKALADALAAQKEALDALQAKLDAKEDFSAELETLNQTHARIQTIAAVPVAAIIDPGLAVSVAGPGAAGTLTVGEAGHAAIEAAGGTHDPETNPKAGGATGNLTPAPVETDTVTTPPTTATATDYSTMTKDQLQTEITSRNITGVSSSSTKADMIAALEADDAK